MSVDREGVVEWRAVTVLDDHDGEKPVELT